MSTLKATAQIGQLTKDSVNGYLRRIRSMLPSDNVYYDIPSLMSHWCLLYLHINEYFDPNYCDSSYSLSNDNTSITKTVNARGAAFLTQIATNGIHIWKIKYTPNGKHTWDTTLAIWKVYYDNDGLYQFNEMNTSKAIHYAHENKLYGWVINYQMSTSGTHSARYPYGKLKCQSGEHIIEIILNLNEYNLQFIHNGIHQGIAFEDIEKTSYRVVFGGYKKGDKIELISYTNY